MALQQAITVNGVTIPNAYHRVDEIQIHRRGRVCNVLLEVSVDKSYSDEGQSLSGFGQQVQFVANDFDALLSAVTQGQETLVGFAYRMLKTLPAYAGASDV